VFGAVCIRALKAQLKVKEDFKFLKISGGQDLARAFNRYNFQAFLIWRDCPFKTLVIIPIICLCIVVVTGRDGQVTFKK
jgi:hypothetical protein